MSNLVKAPLVVHNLHGGPEKNRNRRHQIIKKFLNAARGGLGGFNELAPSDRTYFKAEAKRRHLRVFMHGLDGAVWDQKIFKVGKPRVKRIMKGGHVGADGVATARRGDDDRRVGPNRYGIYLPCRVVATGFEFEFVVTHTIAKAFTAARWRVRLFTRSITSLASGIQLPDGLLVGDMNSREYINLPDVLDVPVKTPPTFGKSRYDQILRWGPHIDVDNVEAVKTHSDHLMLVGLVKFYRTITRKETSS